MPDANLPFYRRGSANNVPFTGLQQNNEPHCVFASIAGAVNYLTGSTVWENAHDLYSAWETSGKGMAFGAVIQVALAQIPDQLKYDIPRERIKNDPP